MPGIEPQAELLSGVESHSVAHHPRTNVAQLQGAGPGATVYSVLSR